MNGHVDRETGRSAETAVATLQSGARKLRRDWGHVELVEWMHNEIRLGNIFPGLKATLTTSRREMWGGEKIRTRVQQEKATESAHA